MPEDAEGAWLWRGHHTYLARDLHGMTHDVARDTIQTELLGAFLHVVPERIVRAVLILAGS
jgi:DNA-nicking Smr family endonuclease